MPENRSRFVLLCQQSLAFGLVAAVAAPAANLTTLDIVAPPHSRPSVAERGVVPAGSGIAGPSLVATKPVKPRVTEFALRGVSRRGLEALRAAAEPTTDAATGNLRPTAPGPTPAPAPEAAQGANPGASPGASGGDVLTVLPDPEPVQNLATVGVT